APAGQPRRAAPEILGALGDRGHAAGVRDRRRARAGVRAGGARGVLAAAPARGLRGARGQLPGAGLAADVPELDLRGPRDLGPDAADPRHRARAGTLAGVRAHSRGTTISRVGRASKKPWI